tara:strand:+ start:293 stop:580 length:288 start_codon:yes stop_codon:yes gene_type:complete
MRDTANKRAKELVTNIIANTTLPNQKDLNFRENCDLHYLDAIKVAKVSVKFITDRLGFVSKFKYEILEQTLWEYDASERDYWNDVLKELSNLKIN